MNLARILSAAISTDFFGGESGLGVVLLDGKIICRDCQTNYMMRGREVDEAVWTVMTKTASKEGCLLTW